MKQIVFILALAAAGFGTQQVLPWWTLPLVAILVAAVAGVRPMTAFWGGLLAGALLWGGMAWWLHQSGEGLLAPRIGQMLGGLSTHTLTAVTALLGGLLCATGALTGSLGRRLSR